MIFRQGQRYEERDARRVYRNGPMASLLVVFALLVLGPWLARLLTQPAPAGVRSVGLVLVIALGLYAWRAATVSVAVTSDGITVRNFTQTRECRWAGIKQITSAPTTSTLLGGQAEYVVLNLGTGALLRPRALRRKPNDARAIAEELEAMRRSFA